MTSPSNADEITGMNDNNTPRPAPGASSSQIIQSNPGQVDKSVYTPLYIAAFEGNWSAFESFFEQHAGTSVNVAISSSDKTALHIAALAGKSDFVEKLVLHEKMTQDMLTNADSGGHTALYFAVVAGNLEAVKAMCNKNSRLPLIPNKKGCYPILEAAKLEHKELLKYLYEMPIDNKDAHNASQSHGEATGSLPNTILPQGQAASLLHNASPYEGKAGLMLLNSLIAADFYDVAIELVERHPDVARMEIHDVESPLYVLAQKSSSFNSGSGLGWWRRLIYSCTHAMRSDRQSNNGTQSPVRDSRFWHRVSYIKSVHDTKLMHKEAVDLVDRICQEVARLQNYDRIYKLVNMPFLVAAECGALDFIVSCLKHFPALIWMNFKGHSILHYSIINRQENVFKFLHEKRMISCQKSLAAFQDENRNNILHLAAKLAPPEKLKTISGAALQMQREIQWFKAVERITTPGFKELKNDEKDEQHTPLEWTVDIDGKQHSVVAQTKSTHYKPRDLFLKEHKNLVEEGEKWMRGLASSCSLVGTLVTTVVFSTAFTVPGGNNQQTGIPIYLQKRLYVVFALSDAVALISALFSVLIFLSALTSRYGVDDFLVSLPRKLINGLAALFISIASMAVAFTAAYFLMFTHDHKWVAIMVASLIGIPALLFIFLLLPLFLEVFTSTYLSTVLHRQSYVWVTIMVASFICIPLTVLVLFLFPLFLEVYKLNPM